LRDRNVVHLGFLLLFGIATAQAQTWSTPTPRPAAGTFSVGAEALVWWLKESPAPVPLVTSSVLGVPNMQTYLGGQSIDVGTSPGIRLSGAYALGDRSGIEGSFFYLWARSKSRSAASSGQNGSTNLVVPYLDAVTNTENGNEISFAPLYSGSATEELSIGMLGGELNGYWAWSSSGQWQTDLLAGFRYLRLRETYTFNTSSPYIPPFPVDVWNTTDRFETTNNFYGAQVGIRGRFDQGSWFGGGAVKVALGAMSQAVDISGSLVTNDYSGNGATQTFPGGYFALPTNIGDHSRTQFSVVPELSLNVGYRITPTASVFAGYSLLYATNVVRPGNQINRTVNTTQSTSYTENPNATLQGVAQPAFDFNTSDFWAQGISVGVAISF
jgi:hypothetical protein